MSQPQMQTLRVLWAALMASPAMLLVVGYVVISERQEVLTPDPILLPVLGAAALGSAAASVILPLILLKPALLALKLQLTDAPSVGPSRGRRRTHRFADAHAARARLLRAVQTPFILGMALAESVALMGFVLLFLGFPLLHVAPMFVVSWALMVSKFPRLAFYEQQLEAAYDADLSG